MVAIVVPIARFCAYGGCAEIGTNWVLDSHNRQWGGSYCDACAEKVRDFINDTEQAAYLERLGIAALMPQAATTSA